jgi:hypothetical protein
VAKEEIVVGIVREIEGKVIVERVKWDNEGD